MNYLFSHYTVIGYSLFIMAVSLLPVKAPERLNFVFADKFLHLIMYGLFSFLFINFLYIKRIPNPYIKSFLVIFCFGVIIEVIQYFLPFRNFEIWDIAFNMAGWFTGCFLIVAPNRYSENG